MCQEKEFQLQLAKSIQAWLWIESELYLLYALLMKGANTHLVSVTFNNIQSVDSKLQLLDSCFSLVLGRNSEEFKDWKPLFKSVGKLNKKRNKIVHEPIKSGYSDGKPKISIGPSFMNAMAIVKGQTTHQGGAIVPGAYNPSDVQLLEDHEIDFRSLVALEKKFKSTSKELKSFREKISQLMINNGPKVNGS